MADKTVFNLSQGAQNLKLVDNGDGTYSLAVKGGGASGYLGFSGGKAVSISASVTRPDNTTQYAAGEVVTSTVPAALTFAGVGRESGGTGLLVDALLIDSANQAAKPSLELWLFSAAPAMDNDNAVFTPTDAELAALLGIIQFQTAFVGDATAGAGGNSVIPSERTYLPVYLKCASTVTAIYGVLVTRSAYTPVSGEIFTVILKVVQD